MANEIAVRQTEVILSPKDAAKYARAFYGANVYKSGGNKLSVEEIFVVIMAGQEYGWGPAASMSNLNLMEGRPELSADAQARFIKAGGKYEYRITEHTDEVCAITVLDAQTGEIIGIERYTIEDAIRMGVKMTTRSGAPTNWAKVPRNMLFARCISNVCAFHCPDAVPMRTYSIGEIDSENRDEETERPQITPEQAAALEGIEGKVEEEIEAEAVEIPAEVQETAEQHDPAGDAITIQLDDDTADVGPLVTSAVPEEDPADDPVYARFIEDSARLNAGEKNLIRQLLDEAEVPFKTSEIVKMMKAKGFTDVRSWLAFTARPAGAPEPEAEEKGPFLPSGMTAQETGGQTATKTITDSQMKKWHARCREVGLSTDEKHKILLRYAGVTTAKNIDKDHFDELLKVLQDIDEAPDAESRACYL